MSPTSDSLTSELAAALAADGHLWSDFLAICDCGPRFVGTPSEQRALALIAARGAAACGRSGRALSIAYSGWSALRGSLLLPGGRPAPVHALTGSIATPRGGLTAEVIDLGRGTSEEFKAHGAEIQGRIVLVRHEPMFVAGTIHRRRKYLAALEAGAVGFLIAGPLAGALVAGSSGRQDGDGIPAAGITPESAAALRRTARGWPRATLTIETREQPAETQTLIFDLPGKTDAWVVISAHVDGHEGGESAIDNASGLAAALAAMRALRPHVGNFRRGVRLACFGAEEWALTGSAQYVAGLGEAERRGIALNVNLDAVGGGPSLAALTSGFAGLEPFLLGIAEELGLPLRTFRPLMANSDHANFALAGIPAVRFVAGFDDPGAHVRYVLTPADTRDKVEAGELVRAASLAAATVAAACNADEAAASRWRRLPIAS